MSPPAKPSNQKGLGILYLSYSEDSVSAQKPLQVLRRICSRFKGPKYIVHINNAAEANAFKKISDYEFEIGGDNRFWDFSGWQKGIDFLEKNQLPCSAFLCVNDMFLHHSLGHRRLVNQSAVNYAVEHNAMVGKLISLPVSGEILGNPLGPYLRTHIFIMAKTVVDQLGSLVSIDERSLNRFFIPQYQPATNLFCEGASISEKIKDFIFEHVTIQWLRKRPYTAENFALLRNKAVAILNSFLLSLRVKDLGFPIVSFEQSQMLSKREMTEAEETLPQYQKEENRFWFTHSPFYNHMSSRKITFTWSNVRDLILGRPSQIDHL